MLFHGTKKKTAATVILTLVCAVFAFYLLLLGAQAYSAARASRILDRLEALRVASPEGDFLRAVQGCRVEKTDIAYHCTLTAGAFAVTTPWTVLWRLPEPWASELSGILADAGLRWWRLDVNALMVNGRVSEFSTDLVVAGRVESLGAEWRIADMIPAHLKVANLPVEEQRTLMHYFAITSIPGGEGFAIDATPSSTQEELRARRINRHCLVAVRGCDGLRELLPDAVPVLKARNRGWGGWTNN